MPFKIKGNNTSNSLKYDVRDPYRCWLYKDALLSLLQRGVAALKVLS